MPTTSQPTSRYATMTASQVAATVQELLAQYAVEDAARRERNAARLAAL